MNIESVHARGAAPWRYAIYCAPAPGTAWWDAGSTWLGRDAASGAALRQPSIAGMSSAELAACTAEPRRYGWHATLKPPFALAEGLTLADLRRALHELCAQLAPVQLPPLQVQQLDHFLALLPPVRVAALDDLAAACVKRLQRLARPLDAGELARRRQAGLNDAQERMLQAWGYPWVLEFFRFHFSLTGPLNAVSEAGQAALLAAAREQFAQLPALRLDRLAVFVESRKGADFELLEFMDLTG